MGFKVNSICLPCLMMHCVNELPEIRDEEKKMAFVRALMQRLSTISEDLSAPEIDLGNRQLAEQYFGSNAETFLREKELSNRFVMAKMEDIRQRIDTAADPLYAGLQFAVLGNYIDFSALQEEVSFEQFGNMLDKAQELEIDTGCYERFRAELSSGKNLLYVADNAGEICFDRLFAEEIHRQFPQLQITFCVRGALAKNDATIEDARLVGIPFPVVENGDGVCGTNLKVLPEKAKKAFREADVILSKGQGNVETLFGSGYNIYYAFLVKCPRFMTTFKKPKMTPMFLREKDMNP